MSEFIKRTYTPSKVYLSYNLCEFKISWTINFKLDILVEITIGNDVNQTIKGYKVSQWELLYSLFYYLFII